MNASVHAHIVARPLPVTVALGMEGERADRKAASFLSIVYRVNYENGQERD